MKNNLTVKIEKGFDLLEQEIAHIEEAKTRQWGVPPIDNDQKKELFVLVKDADSKTLAHGQMVKINQVVFNNQTFNMLGIGGIMATIRSQGYGKILMEAIRDYLKKT